MGPGFSPEQIIDHIRSVHVEFDEGWWEGIEEQVYRHQDWYLGWLPMNRITLIHCLPVHESRLEELAELRGEPPAIVIDSEFEVIDGAHRVVVAQAQGKSRVLAFWPQGTLWELERG